MNPTSRWVRIRRTLCGFICDESNIFFTCWVCKNLHLPYFAHELNWLAILSVLFLFIIIGTGINSWLSNSQFFAFHRAINMCLKFKLFCFTASNRNKQTFFSWSMTMTPSTNVWSVNWCVSKLFPSASKTSAHCEKWVQVISPWLVH